MWSASGRRGATMRRYVQRDLRRCQLAVCTEVGDLHRSNVLESEWRIAQRLYRAQQHRSERRTALPLLKLRTAMCRAALERAARKPLGYLTRVRRVDGAFGRD